MGVALRERRPTCEAVHITMEPSSDDMLEPEVLVLRADALNDAVIMGDNKPDVPLYRLGESILHWVADPVPSPSLIALQRVATASSLQASPNPIFNLYCKGDGSGQYAYGLSSLGPSAPEDTIELRPQTPLQAIAATASAATWEVEQGAPLLEAVLRRRVPRPIQAHPTAAAAARDDTDGREESFPAPAEELLFSTRPRWLSTTELNYLGADGRQLACEDRDYDENDSDGRPPRPTRRLVITVPMERRLRDALVGVWCLRLWREEIRGDGLRWRRLRGSRGRGWAAEKDVGAGGAGVPRWDGRSKPRGEASLGQGTEGARVPV